MYTPATTIDEVIAELDRVIADCRSKQSRLGYFPALYRKVTVEVKKGIQEGLFEDGDRMEQLDVIFANRYLEALGQYQRGELPTQSWMVAFEASRSSWPIVLQHLLLGMNAHINLDLGIAAARTAPGSKLPGLQNDFNRINDILAALVNDVKAELTQVWPLLGLLDRLSGDVENVIVDFSMAKGRNAAWDFATKLAPLDPATQAVEIAARDKWTAGFGEVIWKRGFLKTIVVILIRLGERKNIPEVIDILL